MTELIKVSSTENDQMTSLKVAEITGKEHRGVMRDIRNMNESLEKLGRIKCVQSYYINSQNKKQPMFLLTEDQSMVLAMGYSIEIRILIQSEWSKLSKSVSFQPKTRLELAKENVTLIEEIEYKDQLLLEQSPKVDAYEVISNSERLSTFDECGKLFGMGRNKLYKWMRKNGYVKPNNVPYQKYVDNCLLDYKIDTINGKQYYVTLMTGKGIVYFQGKIKDLC